jgi:hypothetical protein
MESSGQLRRCLVSLQQADITSVDSPILSLYVSQADILPEEYPPALAHAHSLRILFDSLPVIAVGSVLGPPSAGLHTWSHKQGEKLAKALAPHMDKLGASLGRLVLTVSSPLLLCR